jgi:hypothetical protein
MTLDWQVVLIAVAAVFARIISMRRDQEAAPATEERHVDRSISRGQN